MLSPVHTEQKRMRNGTDQRTIRSDQRNIFAFTFGFVRCEGTLRARSHLATATQIFDVVSMSSDIGCMVTNLTIRT